ncbi:unnamed protein product [Ectocarpus fasciculatus]
MRWREESVSLNSIHLVKNTHTLLISCGRPLGHLDMLITAKLGSREVGMRCDIVCLRSAVLAKTFSSTMYAYKDSPIIISRDCAETRTRVQSARPASICHLSRTLSDRLLRD